MILNGKYNTCEVFTNNIDSETISQIISLLNMPYIKGETVRIMPDCHAGKGCVIGTTMTLNNQCVVPNLVGVDIGCFTGDTEVWCSAGFYKTIKELAEETDETKKTIMVDSFNLERNEFNIEKALAFKTRKNADLVAVTYHNEQHSVTVRCTPDHKFLCCFEPDLLGTSYKSHTLYWKEAKDLKHGDRLVAEDSRVFVDDVTVLDEKEDVYCLNVEENHNFAIKYGVIVHNCGMHALKLEEKDLDMKLLDEVINTKVPSGFSVHEHPITIFDKLKDIRCNINIDNSNRSLGSLGGGNHFIEIDKDKEGYLWLVIHTGSRHLGIEVCKHYQEAGKNNNMKKEIEDTISDLKSKGLEKEIEGAIKKIKEKNPTIPKELAYINGELFNNYIHDMKITQEYAKLNRQTIAKIIIEIMNLHVIDSFDTIHNYIDTENMILRKGSISAQKDERVIIPMNMRDGSLICIGKGNPDWNYSAPHGAGRIMSRGQAKDNISLEEFQNAMDGIYSSSVCESTIDEAPQVYKPIEEIMDNIKDTVDIIDIIKPIYNFKAS